MLKWRVMKNQAGDTIVEVLLVLAILTLVLACAYSLTNHNTASTLDAQERNQAIKLIESQIELLKVKGNMGDDGSGHPNQCFDISTGHYLNDAECIVNANGVSGTSVVPEYNLTITSPAAASGNPYTITATWDSAVTSNTQRDNITMYYRPD